ncbi:MAG: YiiD C-terminal domain-containing protein [Myxococcota bacterium]|jgi:acyl-coenzyme A thioesterase PaaI-like protein|nr:YiiD C-terminal domain-containing protein [Myxococcota bacterium]
MSDEQGTSPEARVQRGMRRTFPIYEYVGLEVRSVQDGLYRCFVPFQPGNMNHIATIHAAIQWAASEVLGGLVMMSLLEDAPFFAVVKKVSIEFKRPARSGITTEALFGGELAQRFRADFEENGEAEFRLDVVVRDEDGVEVACAEADYLARKPRKAAG